MDKFIQLHHWLLGQKKVAVAFSGGVDSSMLLAFAAKVLGKDHVLAISATSPLDDLQENRDALDLIKQLGVKHIIIESGELDDENFLRNDSDRCFFCKKLRFEQLKEVANLIGYDVIVDGSNVDDLNDYRPGMKALELLGVYSPLMMCGFTKADIRELAKEIGVAYWDKPANSCLATRIPTGVPIELEKLQRIEAGEDILKHFGCGKVRLRDHDQIARIEVMPEDMSIILNNREQIYQHLHQLGYDHVTLDLKGYMMGSMNQRRG